MIFRIVLTRPGVVADIVAAPPVAVTNPTPLAGPAMANGPAATAVAETPTALEKLLIRIASCVGMRLGPLVAAFSVVVRNKPSGSLFDTGSPST